MFILGYFCHYFLILKSDPVENNTNVNGIITQTVGFTFFSCSLPQSVSKNKSYAVLEDTDRVWY